MLDQYVPNLKKMKAIALDVGLQDNLIASNKVLVEGLTRFGVQHTFETYEGDHSSRSGSGSRRRSCRSSRSTCRSIKPAARAREDRRRGGPYARAALCQPAAAVSRAGKSGLRSESAAPAATTDELIAGYGWHAPPRLTRGPWITFNKVAARNRCGPTSTHACGGALQRPLPFGTTPRSPSRPRQHGAQRTVDSVIEQQTYRLCIALHVRSDLIRHESGQTARTAKLPRDDSLRGHEFQLAVREHAGSSNCPINYPITRLSNYPIPPVAHRARARPA